MSRCGPTPGGGENGNSANGEIKAVCSPLNGVQGMKSGYADDNVLSLFVCVIGSIVELHSSTSGFLS